MMAGPQTEKRARNRVQVRFVAQNGNSRIALEVYVRKQMASTFDRFWNRISGTAVSLRDINGPRGGIDKHCRVRLRLSPKGQITVIADAANEFAAATTAIARAQRAFVRHLERRTRRRRRQDSLASDAYEVTPMKSYTRNVRKKNRSPQSTTDVVGIGSTVVVRDLSTNEVESYSLVNDSDADIRSHRISTLTPAGRAFYGRRAGDIVKVAAPGGTYRFRIERVSKDGHLDANHDALSGMIELGRVVIQGTEIS